MSRKALATTEHTSGTPHAHNFKNRYFTEEQLPKPDSLVAERVRDMTQDKLLGITISKTKTNFGTSVNTMGQEGSSYVKFISKGSNGAGQKQRIVQIQQAQQDPFNPSLFKHKKVPRGPSSQLPPQVLRSPAPKLSQQDYNDWKIPPCTSNWKNNRGYVIPLQVRLAADGRSLQTHTINQRFAQQVDTLFVAEQESRRQLQELAQLQKLASYKEHLDKEERLKAEAQQVRREKKQLREARLRAHEEAGQDSEQERRDELRYIRGRQVERQVRQKNMGARARQQARQERIISEKVDLKRVRPTVIEDVVDQRVFGDTAGLEQGFGESDQQNVFTKPLFQGRGPAVHKIRVLGQEEEVGVQGLGETVQGKLMRGIKFHQQ